MRIIGGEFGSRRLKTPPGLAVRPTPDRLRQALFDVLAPRLPGSLFVDAYAGSGSVGIEALSRGAGRAVFLERDRRAIEVIRENLAAFGLQKRAAVISGPVLAGLAHYASGIVFLDPPYDLVHEYTEALAILGRNPPALVLVQHTPRLTLDERHGSLARTRVLKHGSNAVSFFEHRSC